MSTSIDNAAFDLNAITPNKRKRNATTANKENPSSCHHHYAGTGSCMEVKSLAELMPQACTSSTTAHITNNNAFEICRKPPKKRSKLELSAETQCFDNAALNLNGPDHVVNPFEIRRSELPAAKNTTAIGCFVNAALNIRGPEKEIRNPFEIMRQDSNVPACSTAGYDNAALRMDRERSPHIRRAIAVPFTPTIGCRINFDNVPLESLTPCTLLAKQLVFSPGPEPQQRPQAPTTAVCATPKKPECELSVISEESLDIIAELDCYQLELENSINEAKIAKRARRSAGRGKNLMDVKNRKSFAAMLGQAESADADVEPSNNASFELAGAARGSGIDLAAKLTPKLHDAKVVVADSSAVQSATDNSGVDYEEIDEATDAIDRKHERGVNAANDDADDDGFQFRNPAPFVRTYKRKSLRRPAAPSRANADAETVANEKEPSTGGGVSGIRHSIRNSIRRLIKAQPKKALSADEVNKPDDGDEHQNMFATLRQSLRRKPKQSDLPKRCEHDISIVADTDRQVFRQQPQRTGSDALQSRSADNLGFRKGVSLRSSIRNTTKNVRSMFKKNAEEYEFE